MIILTDYDAIKGIVNRISLNTTFTDRSNRRLVNASIYLSEYQLDVHYIARHLNLVPDALSHLTAAGDTVERQKADPTTLDAIFDNLPQVNLILAEATISNKDWQRFRVAYKKDTVYSKIIEDLTTPLRLGHKPSVTKDNKDIVSALKPGHLFHFIDSLLYN